MYPWVYILLDKIRLCDPKEQKEYEFNKETETWEEVKKEDSIYA